MGFYDNRCMLTGVSLRGSDAVSVLLQEADGKHHPIALPIKGTYDRLGSIDFIVEDANTRLILKYFLGKLGSGEFVVDEYHFRALDKYPIKELEHVLEAFERNMNDGHENYLDGQPILFALVCRAVWDSIARSGSQEIRPASIIFQQLFKDAPIPNGIYGGNLTKVSRHLRELSRFSALLTRRRLPWRPTEANGAQHSSEEMLQYLQEARRAFKSSPLVLGGLKSYETEVAECFTD